MGAWTFVRDRIREILGDGRSLRYCGRDEAASPAVGSPRIHRQQLEAFLNDVFSRIQAA
jgi:2-oxoglutarate dehydrogenase E1 component